MKKLLSLVLALVTLLSVATFTTGAATADVADTAANYLVSSKPFENITVANSKVYGFIGDTDQNKDISILDATQIQLSIAKLATLNSTATLLADTDRDNDISIIDVTNIQLYVAKVATSVKIGHTLYEITTSSTNVADQVIAFLKAHTVYDSQYQWYRYSWHSEDYSEYVSISYRPDDGTISISSDNEDNLSVFITVKLEKDEYSFNYFSADKFDSNYNTIFSVFGEIKQVKSSDRKVTLTDYMFDTESDLTFADVEKEVQTLINYAIPKAESLMKGYVTGNLYTLFA